MELKGLILGIFFSTGLFAIKTGIGMHYYLEKEQTGIKRFLTILVLTLIYGAIFFIGAGMRHLDIGSYFNIIQNFLKSGMLIHFVLAFMLLSWGIKLLKNNNLKQRKTRAWIFLTVPCPVCITMIVISLWFIGATFSDSTNLASLAIYFGFMATIFLIHLLMKLMGNKFPHSAESLLGGAMIAISLYFLMLLIFVPYFNGLEEIFRLSQSRDTEDQIDAFWRYATYAITASIFIAGFLGSHRKIRRLS